MSVRLDNFAMMAIPLPEHLWKRDNTAAPGYSTCVDGFYDEFEHAMLDYSRKSNPVGKLGILYDGMNLDYCYYGAVLGYKSCYSAEGLFLPPISARQFGQASSLVFEGWCKMPWFEEWCKTPWTTSEAASPRLHFINHWH